MTSADSETFTYTPCHRLGTAKGAHGAVAWIWTRSAIAARTVDLTTQTYISAEAVLNTETIFMPLLDEGTCVLRPTKGLPLGEKESLLRQDMTPRTSIGRSRLAVSCFAYWST